MKYPKIIISDLKKGINGMFMQPDEDNGITEPTVIISSKIDNWLVAFAKGWHEASHWALWYYVSTNNIKMPTNWDEISELIAKVNELYHGEINQVAGITVEKWLWERRKDDTKN